MMEKHIKTILSGSGIFNSMSKKSIYPNITLEFVQNVGYNSCALRIWLQICVIIECVAVKSEF